MPSFTFLEYLLILEGLIGLSWGYNSHLFPPFSPSSHVNERKITISMLLTSEKWINSVSQIAKYLSIDKVGNTGWKWGFICLAGLSYIFSQQLFTCSKSTVKTLEKGRNMLKGNNKETRTTSMTSFCHWLSWYKTSFLYKSLHKNFFVQWIICWDFIRYEYHITAYTWFVKLCLPKFP